MINYYLIAGGHNPPLELPVGDGNDRIAFTGERHGFAAPVDPEGHPNLGYDVLAETLSAIREVAHLLADMDEEYDDLALGFVPDHYLTEYCHPGDAVRREVVNDLERFRGMGPRDLVARTLLFGGFSFPAINLQADFDTSRAIVLASPSTLGIEVQQRLADFVLGGGRLLLVGVLPTRDTDGTTCTVLADALGLTPEPIANGTPHYFPSVRVTSPESVIEVRVGYLQPVIGGEPFVHDVSTGKPVGTEVHPGAGHAIVLTCDYPAHLPFWTAMLARLGVHPRHTHDAPSAGIVITSTANPAGQRLLHVLNVSPHSQTFTIRHHNSPVPGATPLTLPARTGQILPIP